MRRLNKQAFTPLEKYVNKIISRKNSLMGFTLIELMVVVLIIGILASIALPSYGKVIEKSRTVEAISRLNAIYKAQIRYLLLESGN